MTRPARFQARARRMIGSYVEVKRQETYQAGTDVGNSSANGSYIQEMGRLVDYGTGQYGKVGQAIKAIGIKIKWDIQIDGPFYDARVIVFQTKRPELAVANDTSVATATALWESAYFDPKDNAASLRKVQQGINRSQDIKILFDKRIGMGGRYDITDFTTTDTAGPSTGTITLDSENSVSTRRFHLNKFIKCNQLIKTIDTDGSNTIGYGSVGVYVVSNTGTATNVNIDGKVTMLYVDT